jgi:hypothetical protein
MCGSGSAGGPIRVLKIEITSENPHMRWSKTLSFVLAAFVILLSCCAQAKEVPLVNSGGVYSVPVLINGVITLHFIVDSGAAEVCIPVDVVSTLVRTGTIQKEDFLPGRTYSLADGSTLSSPRFIIRELDIGGQKIKNVPGTIAPMSGPLLLGQSFLERVEFWALDNTKHVLVIGDVKKSESKPVILAGPDHEGGKVASAVITSPREAEEVSRSCLVTGSISGVGGNVRAFLLIQSTAAQFGQRLYPQGEIVPGEDGRWTLRGIYASPNYGYRTYVVVTENPGSAQLLIDQESRMKGLGQLPADTRIISPPILVNRK